MKKIWFKKTVWFYFPVTAGGYIVTLLAVIFMIPIIIAVDRDAHSVTDELYEIFIYATCTAFWWKGVQTKHLNNMRRILAAFKYALAGMRYTFQQERNFKIELLCALSACTAGFVFHITGIEWCIVLINTGAVLSAELFNTGIEKMCNEFSREIRPGIKAIKDVSAAAVLIFAIIAVVCGLIIFVPHFLRFI